MKIVCVGAGSIGLLVTAKLAAAGVDIALVARTDEQAVILSESGLTLAEGETERTLAVPVRSFERLEAQGAERWPDGEPDWVLLTVKQQHVSERLLTAVRKIAGRGRLLCFQNGIGHVGKIAAFVPPENIDLAVTTEGAKKLSASRVEHTGSGVTWIGPAARREADGQAAEAQKMMEKAMNEAGFRAFLSNQMEEVVWNKLLLNAVINPLTALTRLRNGELPATEARRRLMRELLEEGIALANGSGVNTRDDLWELLLDVCARTAGNVSSMLQDVSEGRKTEIDWINGAMLEAARAGNIPMPLHEAIYKLVKAVEPGEIPDVGQPC